MACAICSATSGTSRRTSETRDEPMNVLTIRIDRLRRLRAICLRLPEASEQETWGDPTWRVRGRIFAMQKGNYAGGRPSLWLKASDGVQNVLVEADPDRFFVPGYVGHRGWVGAYLDAERVDWAMLGGLVKDSYRLIAPKRLAGNAASREESNTLRSRPPRRGAASRGSASEVSAVLADIATRGRPRTISAGRGPQRPSLKRVDQDHH